ncbi:MAG TPA: phosphoribosyltransferase family protein [Gemmatimonadaceae bacterium]|nr:phosphoribosyltransferase family protein [Gemmatimonadaceae bacterium]
MEYRTVAQLDDAVVSWLADLPRDIDIVAGIPRSGLLVANLLALHLNVPMTDVAGLIEGRVIQSGARFKGADPRQFLSKPRHVLVVDDSICSGSAMQKVKASLAAAALPHRVSYAAVYMAPEARLDGHVDLYREIVPMPRVFEWNLMHGTVLTNSCMDIDGVLCLDPTDEQNDDGPEYLTFLRDTPALLLPTAPVGWLVTSRLEKYRAQTVEWLARHKVQYGELRMMQYPDMAARRAARAYARFKSEIYLETGAWLFIESDAALAVQIAQLSGRSVFCTETREMLAPGAAPSAARRAAPPQEPALGAALRATARAMRQQLRAAYRKR